MFFAAFPIVPSTLVARCPLLAHGTQQEAASPTVPRGKKLVMKDGTSQIVRSYEVQGDHVRYFSVERSEWEEIPASLVDWPATQKAAADEQTSEAALTNKVKAAEDAAKAAAVNVDASLEVVPGVFLPPGDGFFILSDQTISPLTQSAASMKLSKGHAVERVLVPIPVIPSRTSVDLPGRRANFRITSPTPEFYLRTKGLTEPQVELIQARVRGDKRHIENIDRLFDEQNQNGKILLLQTWKVADGVYRFTLGQSLSPGEYAIVQFSSAAEELSAANDIDLSLWDFGVDAPRKQATGRK